MRIHKWVLLATVVALLFTGCQPSVGEDSFNVKTDYQYQYFQPDDAYTDNITEDEDGNIYYLAGCYIYKYDVAKKMNAPLCNKSNCLHDKEKAPDRYRDCNAYYQYIGTERYSSIAYENGYIYIADPGFRNEWNTQLIRISKDGSERDVLHRSTSQPLNSIFHRGYFYYQEETFDKNNHQSLSIKRYPLNKKGRSETIWQFPAGGNGYGIQGLKAYGHYLYFNATGDLDEDSYYNKYFSYDIKNCKLKEIKPTAYRNPSIFNITFFNNKILYYSQDGDHLEDKYYVDIYECDLDGTNSQRTGIRMPVGWDMYSDGKYFIVSDDNLLSMAAAVNKEKNEKDIAEYKVYDRDYKLVDTYSETKKDDNVANDGYGMYYAPIGIGNMSYCVVRNNDTGTAVLYGGTKSQIGKINGGQFRREKLASIGRSPAVRKYLDK